MSNVDTLLPLETVSETVLLIESQTPAAPRTDHTMNTDTTVTMPNAIESRNDTFITDQGSMRLRRRRGRRGGREAARRCAALVRREVGATGAVGAAGAVTPVDCSRAAGATGATAIVSFSARDSAARRASASRACCAASSGGGGG